MRFTSASNTPDRRQLTAGFTLIEMLVIAPIAMLIIAGFIALMVSMVGSIMTTRDLTKMTYDAQSSLNSIEQDTRLSLEFMTKTTGVQTPQGTGANFTGSGNFTNDGSALILKSLATTKNPTDASRKLVYYANQPNTCGLTQTSNQIFVVTVVYFMKDNSLWRRTITPPYNTNGTADINTICDTPWQLRSCSPGHTAPLCQTNDIELMQHVTAMTINYYSDPGSTTALDKADSPSANTVKVTLTGTQKVAGKDTSTSQSVIASKINSNAENVGPTPLAINQQPSNRNVDSGATATFTSKANFGNATVQWQLSTNGGSSWNNISGATNTTLSLTNVNNSMDGRKYRMVATAYGSSVTSNAATLTVTAPAWTPLDLLNGWVQHTGSFASPAYYVSASGEVFIKGLLAGGNTSRDTAVAILPPELRPDKRMIFTVGISSSTNGRVDVHPNGEIRVIQSASSYTSLDSIHFMPPGSCSMTAMTPINGWSNYSSSYEPLASCKDSDGRVHTQGLLSTGTTTTNTIIASWPSGFAPGRSNIMPAFNHEGAPSANYGLYSTGIVSRFGADEYLSVQGSHYPASYNNWNSLPMQNGWVNYSGSSGGYDNAQYTKSADGVVNIRGLIKAGTATRNTVIATLPVGYRPSEQLIVNGTASSGYARIDIKQNGDIVFISGSNGWLSLSDITFVTTP